MTSFCFLLAFFHFISCVCAACVLARTSDCSTQFEELKVDDDDDDDDRGAREVRYVWFYLQFFCLCSPFGAAMPEARRPNRPISCGVEVD